MATANNNDPSNGNIAAPITQANFVHRQTEYQVFPEEFFSGSDVTIYFGDLYVDTITGIEFTLQEQLRPIFGYADYTYSDISRGQRIVQGTFRIAFKESGYLFTILEHIAQLGDKARPALAYLETNQDVPDWHASARQTIEDLLDYYYNPVQGTYQTSTSQEVVQFDWPTMWLGSTDSSSPSEQATAAGYSGAVSHLQKILLDGGWVFPSANVSLFEGLKQRFYDGDMWPTKEQMDETYATYGNQTTDWSIYGNTHTTLFWGTNHNSNTEYVNWFSKGRDPVTPIDPNRWYVSDVEKALEERLHMYTFLKDNDAMDFSGAYGKYTDLVRHGVALFQYFANYVPNQSELGDFEAEWIGGTGEVGWGGWVDKGTAELLSLGLTVNGVYDVPTKQMVYRFQKDNGLEPTGICDSATIDMLSRMYNIQTVTNTSLSGGGELSRAGSPANTARTFDARIAAYESEIWARQESGDNDHNRRTFFYDGGFTSTGSEPQMPKLKKTGFDIMITYGPIGVWALQNVNKDNPTTYNGSLDPVSGPTKNAPFPNTVHSIRAVQLASIGQVINADGTPIEEIYAFMARDLD